MYLNKLMPLAVVIHFLMMSELTCEVVPCSKVCGEPASGFHYGVDTCSACKVGFSVFCVAKVDARIWHK